MGFSLGKPIGDDSPGLFRRVVAKLVIDVRTGCHIWKGAYSSKRRGLRPVIRVKTRVVQVARLVLEWKAGPPPSPLHEAGHTCPHGEDSRCVNPDHLAWQTRTENEQHKHNGRPGNS